MKTFQNEVWVHCVKCSHLAIARRFLEVKRVRLSCVSCEFRMDCRTEFSKSNGEIVNIDIPAHHYFNPVPILWFSSPFQEKTFWAYNPSHLDYLEKLVSLILTKGIDHSNVILFKELSQFNLDDNNLRNILKLIEDLRKK